MKSKHIRILTKPKFPEVKSTLRAVVSWLRERHIEVVLKRHVGGVARRIRRNTKTQLANKSDVLLVLGGDGTMLNAARLAGERSIPILGVNMGGVGISDRSAAGTFISVIEQIFANDFVLDERIMLKTHIHRHGETVAQGVVLNDVVISKGTLAHD
ncbi:MAG: NAD(+)/NADH kinase [Nitrospiraceae bacterium]